MIDHQDQMLFDCDDCKSKFTIDNCGFLGEERHLQDKMENRRSSNDDAIECSPLMNNFLSICNVCYAKRYSIYKNPYKKPKQ